ncbi:hypothetical protein TSAR_005833 [Trichomalopsis sarcophagae]|uniref:Uncharacterized protein n=1 Tax=Trichomalopsis sarcophagae TaxID=543379 RepID=A0A232EVV0_9HYME|nr:hypothetical protein TSAR_005833 [Trichomalopsis sarcophagae]
MGKQQRIGNNGGGDGLERQKNRGGRLLCSTTGGIVHKSKQRVMRDIRLPACQGQWNLSQPPTPTFVQESKDLDVGLCMQGQLGYIDSIHLCSSEGGALPKLHAENNVKRIRYKVQINSGFHQRVVLSNLITRCKNRFYDYGVKHKSMLPAV